MSDWGDDIADSMSWDYYSNLYEKQQREKDRRRKSTPPRSVQYVGPGHTRVRYAHRTLNIRFKETEAEFKRRQKLRRKHGAIQGAKKRTPRTRDNAIYVDMVDGRMVYVDSRGREINDKARRIAERGTDAILKKDLKRDRYNIEEMRALLRDARWEEVAGNKRWSYDSKATVREFNKYKKKYGGF